MNHRNFAEISSNFAKSVAKALKLPIKAYEHSLMWSCGERGQSEEESMCARKNSTGNDENNNLIISRTRDTKSRPIDERTVCNGRSDEKESTEKQNSDDCVFKLDSFKTIECQW